MLRKTLDGLRSQLDQADNLPSPPDVALELARLADDPNARADDLGALLRTDPGLTARLLRAVNAPANGLPRSIDSIERACALLGFDRAKTLALGYSMAEALPVVGPDSNFDLEGYWLRSGLTAAATEHFAEQLSPDHADSGFVVGLLSEMGRLVLAGCMTTIYQGVLATEAWPTPATERSMLGFSNVDVATLLFERWHLPDEISMPIAYRDAPHELPDDASSDVIRLCRFLASAQVLADAWVSGGSTTQLDYAAGAANHYLGMSTDQFAAVVEALSADVDSHRIFSNAAPPAEVNRRRVEDRARDQLREAVSRSSSSSRLTTLLRDAHA